MNIAKCQICKEQEAEWAWQPFGPSTDSSECMAFLGSHIRGFVVIKVCEDCKENITKGHAMEFDYKGSHYIGDKLRVILCPSYISDPLAYFEDTCANPVKEPFPK